MEILAELPNWLKYGMVTGLMLVILSRAILAIESSLKESKTGLLIGTGSVTITVMLTLAFTAADEQLILEFLFVVATGGLLFLWDVARLYARRGADSVENPEDAAAMEAIKAVEVIPSTDWKAGNF